MNMTAKEYAEKYVGCKIVGKAGTRRERSSGIVSGYGSYHNEGYHFVVYENEGGVAYPDLSYRITLLRPLKRFSWFPVDEAYMIDVESPNIPDDCLDCGAKGNDPCKDGCPNKDM